MSTFTRPSAAAASVVVISAAFGFGLGASVVTAKSAAAIEISNGPRVASPNESRENLETRSIAGYRSVSLKTRSLSFAYAPRANAEAPVPGDWHANLGRNRSIASSCLVAMN